ncbi:hypothetical protein Pint_09077 [Pistacia integerrima]|uniref:Uncharacterized protein n=1 Tax=Pistacia integerrima TaxID=434235 RepID=A0ACC0XWF8_9ROSI|nr:hypothetical protein Pint_09077 [Pistacia integerrima]
MCPWFQYDCAQTQWFAGALFIVIGVLILSKSNVDTKESID